jgi:hypothetical protein
MIRLLKPLEQLGIASFKVRSLAVSLALATASFAFLFLMNRQDFSIKDTNVSLLEAQSIQSGEITLPQWEHDTALYKDQVINVFQPGQTIFFLVHLIAAGGHRGVEFFQVELFLIFVLSVFLFSLALFRLSGGQSIFSMSLAASAMFGAPYIANLPVALHGSVYRVNHVLSILFVAALLFLVSSKDLNQRLLLISACIGATMLFRMQYALLLFLPLTLILQDAEGRSWRISEAFSTPADRLILAGRVAKLFVFPLLAVIIIAGFQMARFQNPFETGYAYIYSGRTDYLAQRASEHGLFSLYFLPENLYRTFLAFPIFEINGWGIDEIIGDPRGNSILFSQPILLTIIFFRESLVAARVQSFLFVSILLGVPVWLYHNPGISAAGYMRLSLDYLPLWIGTVAVFARYAPRSRHVLWASFGLALWSVLYGIALLTLKVSEG